MKCNQCNEEFEGRAGAKYCSTKCRVKANRNKTDGVSVTDVTDKLSVTVTDKPANFGQPDCECRHCRNNQASGGHKVINHGPYKTAFELGQHEINRVSLPGDVDYKGVA